MATPVNTKEDLITVLALHATLSKRFGLSEVTMVHKEARKETSYMSLAPGVEKAKRSWRKMTKAELLAEIERLSVIWCWVVISYDDGINDFELFNRDDKLGAYEYANTSDMNDRPEVRVVRNSF